MQPKSGMGKLSKEGQEEEETKAAQEIAFIESTKPPEPADLNDGLPRCLICTVMITTKDVMGESMQEHEAGYMKIYCTPRRPEKPEQLYYLCDRCRFNTVVVNKVSQKLLDIFTNTNFKVVKGVHQ